SGRLVLYNDEAAALLGLPEPDESEPIALAEAALPESVRDLLSTGRVAVDEIHLTEDRVLVISQKQASQPRSSGSGGRGSGAGDAGHSAADGGGGGAGAAPAPAGPWGPCAAAPTSRSSRGSSRR